MTIKRHTHGMKRAEVRTSVRTSDGIFDVSSRGIHDKLFPLYIGEVDVPYQSQSRFRV